MYQVANKTGNVPAVMERSFLWRSDNKQVNRHVIAVKVRSRKETDQVRGWGRGLSGDELLF